MAVANQQDRLERMPKSQRTCDFAHPMLLLGFAKALVLARIQAMVDYTQIIVRDPQVCRGEPVIRGTRVLLRTILASLAEGDSIDNILQSFPTLSREDLVAVIAYAAASVQEDLPVTGIPS